MTCRCSSIKYQGRTAVTPQHNTYIMHGTQCYSERPVYVLTNPTVATTRKRKITWPSCRAPPARFRLTMPIRTNRHKSTRASTVSSPNLLRVFVTTFPAAEKTRSDATDEAGIAKYLKISWRIQQGLGTQTVAGTNTSSSRRPRCSRHRRRCRC